MLWTDMIKDVEQKRPEFLKAGVFKEAGEGDPIFEYEKNYQLSIQVTEDMPPNEVIATISTEEVDRYGDIVRADGGVFGYWEANKVVLFGHNSNALPVGQGLWIKKMPGKVISRFRFNDSAFAQDVNKLVKSGDLRATSIGFIPVEAEWIIDSETGEETGGIEFTKWELLEYSVVPVPANRGALMQAVGKGMGMTDKMKNMLELGEAPGKAPKTEEKDVKADDTAPEEKSSEKASEGENVAHAQIAKHVADKLKEAEEEITKDGQVLSAKNKKKLAEASKLVNEVLESAGSDEDKEVENLTAELEALKKESDELKEEINKLRAKPEQKEKAEPEAKGQEIDNQAIMARLVDNSFRKYLGKKPR